MSDVAVTTARMPGEEHSDRNTAKVETDRFQGGGHHAWFPHSVIGAGSIVLHVSNSMNEVKKDDEDSEDGEEESNLQKRKCSLQRLRMKEEISLHHVKVSPISLVNSTKNFYGDNEQDEYGNESNIDVHTSDTEETTRIPEITSEELQDAIRKLEKGKSPDSDGIRAEDIKACDEETKEMVRLIFNEITRQNEFTPEAWKKVKIKVLHQKGDVENVGKYRPT